MELKKYFERIQYDGPLNTEAATLTNISDCHTQKIPFEIFNMFGGTPKTLSMEKIYSDIIVKKRGGFCYEQNMLFSWVLKEIGFEVVVLRAQIYAADNFGPKFDHMCLMVTSCDGQKWLVDVGCGGTSFVLPLKFVEMEKQLHPNGAYRIRKKDETTFLVEKITKKVIGGKKKDNEEAKLRGWNIVYQFETTPYQFKDFEDMCKYQQENENSFLKFNAISYLQTKDGGLCTWGFNLCKKKYIDSYTEEIVSVVKAEDEKEFKKLIEDEMGIHLDFHLKPIARNFFGFTD